MKQNDLLLELRELARSLQHAREYIQSGMGRTCPFLKDESQRLNQIVDKLEKEYNQFIFQHPTVKDFYDVFGEKTR